MEAERLSGAKQRLLEQVKRSGAASPGEIAEFLGLTDAAVRQHLQALAEAGLVRGSTRASSGRGRPTSEWSLTPLAQQVFPDRHADLTVELIGSARAAFGEEGLDRLIEHRAQAQTRDYRRTLDRAGKGLGAKVRALARRRTAEGYMAEAIRENDGSYLLIEHHCPICEAASECSGLCKAEQRIFREALGDGVRVDRIEHLLSEGTRCVYRIDQSDGDRV